MKVVHFEVKTFPSGGRVLIVFCTKIVHLERCDRDGSYLDVLWTPIPRLPILTTSMYNKNIHQLSCLDHRKSVNMCPPIGYVLNFAEFSEIESPKISM